MRYFHLLGKQCVSLGDQAVNIEEVCLYLVSDVVLLIFLRHKNGPRDGSLLQGQQEP